MIFLAMLKARIEDILIKDNHSGIPLLSKIEFELIEGKIYSILGENGTGKSTLIKSLTCLLNEHIFTVKGSVQFKNEDIFNFNEEQLRHLRLRSIRYVFQDAVNSFDPLKTFEYYFINSKSGEAKIEELLKYFLLPEYDKLSKLYPYEVSGGMAQRIGIVLAFLANPKLIILDEPTSGIDYAISNLLLHKLLEFKKKENGTGLIVTHDIKFAEKVSDELAVLEEGTLNEFMPKADFLSQSEIIPAQSIKDL